MQKLSKRLVTVALPAFAVVGIISLLITRDWLDGLLSLGIGTCIATFVVAVFSQPGSVQLSPQREVAIATGHTDRRTVFERPGVRPFMLVLLSVCHSLNMPRAKDWIRRTLIAEGNENYYTAEEYLAVSLSSGIALGVLLGVAYLLAYGVFSLVLILIGLAVGTFLSIFLLYNHASKRLRQISKRVPYSLDLVSLAMGAGATFTEAVKTVIHEDVDDPFSVELRTVLAEMELGETRRKSLQNLADRVPLDNLRSIVASVIQAEELGTPLGDVLHAQASLMRLQRSVRAENAAAVASVRILVPSLLILMSVIIAVFGPAIVRAIRGGLI
jgi:tight adherence protein C